LFPSPGTASDTDVSSNAVEVSPPSPHPLVCAEDVETRVWVSSLSKPKTASLFAVRTMHLPLPPDAPMPKLEVAPTIHIPEQVQLFSVDREAAFWLQKESRRIYRQACMNCSDDIDESNAAMVSIQDGPDRGDFCYCVECCELLGCANSDVPTSFSARGKVWFSLFPTTEFNMTQCFICDGDMSFFAGKLLPQYLGELVLACDGCAEYTSTFESPVAAKTAYCDTKSVLQRGCRRLFSIKEPFWITRLADGDIAICLVDNDETLYQFSKCFERIRFASGPPNHVPVSLQRKVTEFRGLIAAAEAAYKDCFKQIPLY
jgi:hypothetical protein